MERPPNTQFHIILLEFNWIAKNQDFRSSDEGMASDNNKRVKSTASKTTKACATRLCNAEESLIEVPSTIFANATDVSIAAYPYFESLLDIAAHVFVDHVLREGDARVVLRVAGLSTRHGLYFDVLANVHLDCVRRKGDYHWLKTGSSTEQIHGEIL